MSKFFLVLIALGVSFNTFGAQITEQTAQNVAVTYFKGVAPNSNGSPFTASLVYTKSESTGTVDFYVFNMSPVKGFVIVTANNNIEPVIAYSIESGFDTSAIKHIGVSDWMNSSASKISAAVSQGVTASAKIQNKWTAYSKGEQVASPRGSSAGPLLTTTWNQEPYYNEYCPYNSTDGEYCVTGCVATAMAQIMKYWNFPAQGVGSYSYNDAPPSFSYNYGVQTVNFGTTTYGWANMPNSLNADNTYVGTLMYQCGVSVAMDYGDDDEGGSGAYVLISDAGGGNPCAQSAYAQYFSYNASTMKGVYQTNYTPTAWVALIQNELNSGRPVQYEGVDPNAGGHTWVCDGYDNDTMFHMNWGWGGYDNGYFSLSSINPNPYDFSADDAALIGIEPTTAATCNVPSTLTTTAITSTTATFNWGAVSGASSYNIQYRIVGTTTWTSANSSTNSFSASGLTASSNYEWQVQTLCAGGSSAFTASTDFTTLASPCSLATGMATGSITDNSANLSWTAVSGASSYSLEWKLSSASTWTTVTGITSAAYSLSSLSASTAYEWQVETVCSGGNSAYTAATSFTTLAPPCNMATGMATGSITDNSAALSWTAVSGASSYTLQWKASSAGTWTTVTGITSASYSVSSLVASTGYQWQVETVCSGGTSAYTLANSFTTLAPPCNMATGMATGSITDNSATLTWTAVSGASSYTLEWKTSSAGTWTTVTGITSASYSLSSLSISTAYQWQVETVCSGGTSAYTTASSFTTLAPPCNAATGMATGSITDNSATLSWTAVSGAASYTLEWKESSAGTWTTVTGITSASYSLSSLSASTAYEWQVETVCSGGTSAYTTASSFTTLSPPCNAATGMATGSITDNSATLSWTAVSGAASYTLEWKTSSAGTWTTVTGITSASYSLSSLVATTAYQWQIETVCSGGNSAYTSATSFTTLAPPCNVTIGMATGSITDNSATLSWTAVSGAASYTLEWKESSAGTWTTVTGITSASYSLSSLSASTAYEWQIETVCSGGNSAYTSATSFTTLNAPCNVATGMATGSITDNSAIISWTAVSGASSYTLEWKESSAGSWTTVAGLTSASYSLSSLVAGTAYEWQIETVCSGGNSAYTSATSFTTLAPPCNVTTGMATGSITDNSASISWTAVSGASSYTLEWKESSAGSWTAVTGLTSASYSLSSLVAGTAYEWQIETVCSGGTSAYTTATSFTTLNAPCNVATGMATGSITDNSATISWTAVSGASSYTLEWKESSAGSWTIVTGLTSASYSLSSLVAGTAYEWQIETVCSEGTSAYTAATNFTTTTPPCGLPTAMATSGITSTSAIFTWAVASGATSYDIQYRIVGTSTWISDSASGNSYNATGLTASSNYQWQVSTDCAANSSAWTNSTNFTTLAPPCTLATGLTTSSITDNSANLSWTAVSEATSYTLQWQETSTGSWTTVTGLTNASYDLSSLSAGTVYQWQVETVCSGGISAFTATSGFTTLMAPCNLTAGLSIAVISDNSASLVWSAVSAANSYTVQWKATSASSWNTITGITDASYNLGGLNGSTTYEWQVETVCSGGSSGYTASSNFTTLAVPCSVPSGMATGNITNNSAVFTWNSVTDAVSYIIQYRIIGAPTWTSETSSTNSYAASDLTPSGNYEWQISTVCSAGSSAFTSSTDFNTLLDSSCGLASGMVTGGITNSSAALVWVAVNGATSYNLEWQTDSASAWTVVTGIAGTSYNLSGLNANTSYQWQVETVCSSGISGYTSATSFTTTGQPCDLTSALATGDLTNNSAVLTWSAVAGATSYIVEYSIVGDTTWTSVTSNTNSYVANGLTASTNYQWQVATVCSSGTSAYTASNNFNTLDLSCGLATGMITDDVTTSSAVFNWTAVSGAANYNIQYRVIGTATWTTDTTSSNTYNATGLTPSTNYEWQVETVCSGNSSVFTASTYFTTSSPSCSIPTGLSITATDDTGTTLLWTTVSGTSSYIVQWKLLSDELWTNEISVNTNSYNLTSLKSCNTYDFRVQGICSEGTSAYSDTFVFNTGCSTLNYCASQGESNTYEYINNVTLGSINNTTAASNASGYANFTNLSTNLVAGNTYTIYLTPGFNGTSYNEYFSVYIDYDQDASLTDAGELIAEIHGTGEASATFTVPSSAVNGPTRMRVQMEYGTYTTGPCETFAYGSVQDYTVNITSPESGESGDSSSSDSSSKVDIIVDNAVKLYPNPAQDNVNMEFYANEDENATWNIFDLLGKNVLHGESLVDKGQVVLNVNTKSLTNGVYILELDNNGMMARSRFIIAR